MPAKHETILLRENILQDIHQQLRENVNNTGKVVLVGPAGVGKTTVALEYAHLHGHGHMYSHVFWLQAESRQALISSLWKCGRYLLNHYSMLSGFDPARVARIFGLETIVDEDARSMKSGRPPSGEDIHLVAKTVIEWFDLDSDVVAPWLLIYDGVQDLDATELSQYMPLSNSSRGHIIVTTRTEELLSMANSSPGYTQGANFMGSDGLQRAPTSPKLQHRTSWLTPVLKRGQDLRCRPVIVKPFTEYETWEKLQERYTEPYPANDAEQKAMTEIVKDINGEPSALVQARSYMEAVGCTASRYREVLQLSNEELKSTNHNCHDTLDALCMLSSDEVPIEVLGTEMNRHILDKGEGRFLRVSGDKKSFSVHSFVRKGRRAVLKEKDGECKAAALACKHIVNAHTNYKKSHPDPVDQWLFEMQLARQGNFGSELKDLTRSLAKYDQQWATLGEICEKHGRPDDAAAFYAIALERADSEPVQDRKPSRERLRIKLAIAQVLEQQGHLATAEALCKEVLEGTGEGSQKELRQKAMGVMISIRLALGQWPDAIKESQSLIRSLEETFGTCDVQTIDAISQLATIQANVGRLHEATLLVERLLMTWEDKQHSASPKALASLEALALLHKRQGALKLSARMYARIVQLKAHRLGSQHVEVLKSQAELAGVLDAQRQFVEANKLYMDVLGNLEKQLGVKHPEYVRVYENSALCWKRQKNTKEARKI